MFLLEKNQEENLSTLEELVLRRFEKIARKVDFESILNNDVMFEWIVSKPNCLQNKKEFKAIVAMSV